jgi:hypothetical protein
MACVHLYVFSDNDFRAKAEADYSKALQNLVKKADGKEETGYVSRK